MEDVELAVCMSVEFQFGFGFGLVLYFTGDACLRLLLS